MLTNVVVDVLAVGWFEWGIRGIAMGTLAQFAVNVVLLGLYMRHPFCSYRLLRPGRWLRKLFVKNVVEGAPVTISNVLMAVTLLLLNNIILGAQGERGLFFWSICLQMFLLSIVFILPYPGNTVAPRWADPDIVGKEILVTIGYASRLSKIQIKQMGTIKVFGDGGLKGQ